MSDAFFVQVCPHVPRDTVFFMLGPVVCPLCEEDVVAEAEKITDSE